MMEAKPFGLSTVLTITTGIFMCDDFDQVYDILNHMTQDNLTTIALPRAADECTPYLYEQHPQLRNVVLPDERESYDSDDWHEWLGELSRQVGSEFDVWPIHAEDHDKKTPVQELIDMGVDVNKITVIELPRISDVGNIDWK